MSVDPDSKLRNRTKAKHHSVHLEHTVKNEWMLGLSLDSCSPFTNCVTEMSFHSFDPVSPFVK